MSTIDVNSLELTTEDAPSRTREGTATVLTGDLLQKIAEAVSQAPEGKLVRVPISRPTPGSAAGMGYQIKVRLEKEPYNLRVKSIPVPADPEAWAELMGDRSKAEQDTEVKRVKASGTPAERAAIVTHLGFTRRKQA